MWLGFDSQIRRHMWVEFLGSLLSIERFSPPLKKLHLTEFALIVNFSFTVSPISAPALERLNT